MADSKVNLRFQAHLRTPSPDPDAGLRGLSHYERRLPSWRYRLRQALIPLVRKETVYLAKVQQAARTPLLDSYFAMSANLGTHTFFMTALPICFWCGYPILGVAMVHMLAAGVYLSGYAKDLVCLPRPLSPPLQRITMSGSAALEYGFPSTHTTNAVSVAMYCLHYLWYEQDHLSLWSYRLSIFGCLAYATSISIGRMYCGMHGFSDVIFGAFLGAFIAVCRVAAGPAFDHWVLADGWARPAMVALILALAVRFHPEPADNCPCFDDSVAFIGVVMGITFGMWHYASLQTNSADPVAAFQSMYMFDNKDIFKAGARLVLGVVVIFAWRATMKPLLLRTLPPTFRFVAHYGLQMPRRYFLQSRDYNTVPELRQDDKVLPPASDIPSMLNAIRRRKRTISVGPQSEADAREMIANREQARQPRPQASAPSLRVLSTEGSSLVMTPEEPSDSTSYLTAKHSQTHLSTPPTKINSAANVLLTPPASENGTGSDSGTEEEKSDRRMFSNLEKPRVRYDVEVITKLVVYAGIAWLAVEGNPLLFARLGIT
ncbi:Dihydrosphingosine 1-phosphate phosphatase [Cercospora beticola]|uniref:Dihydrosphingosine 1-phosphate phosphatase n=1 Tax=Cercospora beticola TaxID=122368 RepID=A0A2G5H934_CERBT|nr:Dihydrosphingosine 1-phosphate phosphatase [Cercospora beticola]PIA88813.1 Dihydrosphingosine 1-phosphate phosphatase [Cercospora beticola]WPB03079.1 hypothetical protein RHO25_007716 [Cercospora beticola]CAK1358216.1 unnamed protein product [Cercospora beticola]